MRRCPRADLITWQALFGHGKLARGQTVVIHGAADAVGSAAVLFSLWAGAQVIGTGRSRARPLATELGADRFIALDAGRLQDVPVRPIRCWTRSAARCSPARASSRPGPHRGPRVDRPDMYGHQLVAALPRRRA